jgi:cytochrome c-type biogenesis protein
MLTLENGTIGVLGAFVGGVLVGFSPCVLPLLPIMAGILGINPEGGRLRGFLLSLTYVAGLATTYSALGLIAALGGHLFGSVATHPYTFILIGTVCIIFGLSFFDVFSFRVPGVSLQHAIRKDRGFIAAFLLGLTSGLIAGPCTAPVLGAILLFVATKQNLVYGALLLFVFAVGMGLLLLLLGIFGALGLSLHRFKSQSVWVKKLSGFLLIGIGEYYVFQGGRLLC